MTTTSIEWTDATWNPVRGCSRVSEGCRHCYAEGVAARFSGPGQPYEGLAIRKGRGAGLSAQWTGEVRFVPEQLVLPLRWKKPRRIFVNSMSDLFHEKLTNEEIAAVFGVMAACPQHTFQVLTKRPERMREWFEWVQRRVVSTYTIRHSPQLICAGEAQSVTGTTWTVSDPRAWPLPNVWLGVSVENQATAERIMPLLCTPAAVRFVSAEPLLGPLNLGPFFAEPDVGLTPGIDWVIVGGESGHGARPCGVAWIRSIVEQCREAGTRCFVKQLGARVGSLPDGEGGFVGQDAFRTVRTWYTRAEENRVWFSLLDRKGGDPSEWPEDLRVREWPEVRR